MNQSNSPEEVQQRIVGRIESLIVQANAGHLDKNLLEFWEWRLIEIYREEEIKYDRQFKIHTKQVFEAMFRQKA